VKAAELYEEALLAAGERFWGGLATAFIELRSNLRIRMSSERAFGFQ